MFFFYFVGLLLPNLLSISLAQEFRKKIVIQSTDSDLTEDLSVTDVELQGNFQVFEQNLCKAFPNVKLISASGINLSTIAADAFVPCKQLESLNLFDNALTHFGIDGSDVRNPTLKVLNLAYNQIVDINEWAIAKNFPNLTKIFIDGNALLCSKISTTLKFFQQKGITVSTSTNKLLTPKIKEAKNVEFIKNISCLSDQSWSRQVKDHIVNNNFPISYFLRAIRHSVDYVQGQMKQFTLSEISSHNDANEADFTRIETEFAAMKQRCENNYEIISSRFDIFAAKTNDQLEIMNRMVWLCYSFLFILITVTILSFCRKSCQPKVMKRTSLQNDDIQHSLKIPLNLQLTTTMEENSK